MPRAYRSSWREFEAWTVEHDLDALPASPGTVLLYLTDRANSGAMVSTLRVVLAAIAAAHQATGLEFNAKQRDLVVVWSGIRRQLGVRPERKAPVLKDDLTDMLATLAREAGTVSSIEMKVLPTASTRSEPEPDYPICATKIAGTCHRAYLSVNALRALWKGAQSERSRALTLRNY